MNTPSHTRLGWKGLREEIARIVRIPIEDLKPDSRLLEDIGLDSIALAEVMVLLVENDQPPPDLEEFEERAWEGVRLIDLIGDQDGVD